MATKVKFEDSTALEDSAKRSGGYDNVASRGVRTIKKEPESAAAVAEEDLMSDDGMEEIEVKNELELERVPNAGGDIDDGVTTCLDCQTTTATRWISAKRWNLQGKLCYPCYTRRLKAVPKVSRECADCGSDDSNVRQWYSGARWGVEWLCLVCGSYRRRHDGASRPQNIDNEPVSCANCGSSKFKSLSDRGWQNGRAFGIDGKLCGPCYNHHRRYKIPRPPSKWVKPPRAPGRCNDCGVDEPVRSGWRRGTRWGIEGKLCPGCYSYRHRNNGQTKSEFQALTVTARACAKCLAAESPRWYKGARMGLPGYICNKCERMRKHAHLDASSTRNVVDHRCADCSTKETSRWKSGARWAIADVICKACYNHRMRHSGIPRDETVPPPAKRKRTGHGKAVGVSHTTL